MTMMNSVYYIIGSFTVGIFSLFFTHFPFHFVSIFLKIETENERKIDAKWNPNLVFAKKELKNDHSSSFWPGAWQENAILLHFSKFPFPRVSGQLFFTSFSIPFLDSFCLFLRQIDENEPKMNFFPKMAQEWVP
jgi:hypothetical protein